jgi:hypothetical protein
LYVGVAKVLRNLQVHVTIMFLFKCSHKVYAACVFPDKISPTDPRLFTNLIAKSDIFFIATLPKVHNISAAPFVKQNHVKFTNSHVLQATRYLLGN